MIKKFNYGKNVEKKLPFVLEFVKEHQDYDFYHTHNNQRIYVDNVSKLRLFLRDSILGFSLEGDYGYQGIILLWKSVGGEKVRYYIKILANNKKVASKLLTALLWEYNKDLYVKITKKSIYLEVFKSKNFRFVGGRGRQILLKKTSRGEK